MINARDLLEYSNIALMFIKCLFVDIYYERHLSFIFLVIIIIEHSISLRDPTESLRDYSWRNSAHNLVTRLMCTSCAVISLALHSQTCDWHICENSVLKVLNTFNLLVLSRSSKSVDWSTCVCCPLSFYLPLSGKFKLILLHYRLNLCLILLLL